MTAGTQFRGEDLAFRVFRVRWSPTQQLNIILPSPVLGPCTPMALLISWFPYFPKRPCSYTVILGAYSSCMGTRLRPKYMLLTYLTWTLKGSEDSYGGIQLFGGWLPQFFSDLLPSGTDLPTSRELQKGYGGLIKAVWYMT